MVDTGQDGRVADLVAVEMQDRQHGAVTDRIEELVGLPGGGQRSGLGLAVPDHAGDDQAGIVECGAEGMAERIAKLATFMDRSRRGRRHMARDAARERELLEQPLQPGLVLADVGVDLAVRAFEVCVRHQRRAAMPGACDVDHVDVVFLDDTVQVDIDEVLSRGGAPVADHQRLHMRLRQRLLQQGIGIQVYLPDRQVVRRPPVGVHPGKLHQ